MSPGRVAIITPPAGVRPIEVSTEWPSRTAVTLQPLPRWAMTIRDGQSWPSWCTTDSHESPWKPTRSTPSLRMVAGSGSTRARSGKPLWNAVSRQAICVACGNVAIESTTSFSAGGTCSGANTLAASSWRSTLSSTRVCWRSAVPPCTMRCPMTAGGHSRASPNRKIACTGDAARTERRSGCPCAESSRNTWRSPSLSTLPDKRSTGSAPSTV